ncbi:hypothetical protein L209DRAFT_71346 [Thermothelomyces heterothallicus CBS 203.75]
MGFEGSAGCAFRPCLDRRPGHRAGGWGAKGSERLHVPCQGAAPCRTKPVVAESMPNLTIEGQIVVAKHQPTRISARMNCTNTGMRSSKRDQARAFTIILCASWSPAVISVGSVAFQEDSFCAGPYGDRGSQSASFPGAINVWRRRICGVHVRSTYLRHVLYTTCILSTRTRHLYVHTANG